MSLEIHKKGQGVWARSAARCASSGTGRARPMAKRWYVVKVQSGRENTVQAALERKLKVAGKTEVVPRVLVPVESVTEVKAGRKRTRKKKLYPGYVLVE